MSKLDWAFTLVVGTGAAVFAYVIVRALIGGGS
jgi:hypothetical protein